MTATSFTRGVSKQIILARETTFGTLAGAGTGKQLRRVNASPMLNKDQIRSQEILPSQQVRDARHGVRRPAIPFSGQLAPGSYTDFIEGMLRRNFAAGATTGAIITVTAAAGPPGTFTRSAGSFLTDGFKIGDVIRWTGWAAPATANNARNFRIIGLTATVMTVAGVGDETVVAKAAGDSVTATVVGKKTFIPATGHLFHSYTIEQLYPDASPVVSERYVGCRMQSLRLGIPASGMCTMDAQLVGKDMLLGAAAYFTSPTAVGSTNSLTGVSGVMRLGGADVALVTQAQVQISCPVDSNPVVGQNTVPEIFPGVLSVEGQLGAYFTDSTYLDMFNAEQEVDIAFYLKSDTTVNSDFMSIVMTRCKTMALQKNDSDRSIVQSISFSALEHVTGAGAGAAYEQTSIILQDSSI